MESIKLDFPTPPQHRGSWTPIQMEPIYSSGELFTVAIYAVLENEAKVIPTINEKTLRCMFGDKARNFQSLVGLILESLNIHKRKSLDISDWTPPFKGVSTGRTRIAAANHLDGVIKQAIRRSASLGDLNFVSEYNTQDEGSESKVTWFKSVKEAMQDLSPNLVGYFNRKVIINNRVVRYAFANEHYVCNFLNVSSKSLDYWFTHGKSSIMDLEDITRRDDFIIQVKNRELILVRPMMDNTIDFPKNSKIKQMQEKIDNLESIAKTRKVSTYRARNPEETAQHIKELALNYS